MKTVCKAMDRALKTAEKTGVEIHLETSLTPNRFAELLSKILHPMLKVNYDLATVHHLAICPTMNSQHMVPEFGSIISKMDLGGNTVALGTGNADFETLAGCLEAVNYQSDIILQVARGAVGDEIAWDVKPLVCLEHILS